MLEAAIEVRVIYIRRGGGGGVFTCYANIYIYWLSDFVDNAFSGLIKFRFAVSLVSIGVILWLYTYKRT